VLPSIPPLPAACFAKIESPSERGPQSSPIRAADKRCEKAIA
jgi:hypothetical protein